MGDTAAPPPQLAGWTVGRTRLCRLGQESVDKLESGSALEQGQEIGPVEDQREARHDHEIRGVQLRSADNPAGDPGVDSVERRGEVGQELAVGRELAAKTPRILGMITRRVSARR